ncbi:MAG: hypothetical protein HY905_21450 [Deltaproteobacteria bacterium]|nr:hypothetical protein [Deltaproteobacteria bacterium]
MSDPILSAEEAIEAAVRVIDEGVDYGNMGIDAPPAVGRRAVEILATAVERNPEDLRLRCVYAATISLSGRLGDAREQLGAILSRDPAYFEAVAELDHPTAWRHAFLSPPWTARSTRVAPLVRRWIQSSGLLKLTSLREGADRIICLLAAAPTDLAADPSLAAMPAALDLTLLTRTAGVFLAIHLGLGGPEPDGVRLIDGFEFPWPEGTGFHSELMLRFFLQQDRTYVILAKPDGSVVFNRSVRFGPEDRERHERFLRRLEAASPRDTDTRLQQAAISRYLEQCPRETLRSRLAYRLKQGHAPPEPPGDDEPPAPARSAEQRRIATVPMVAPSTPDDLACPTPPEGLPSEAGAAGGEAATAGTAPPAERGAPRAAEPLPPDEMAARSALAVAGLWPWVRREKLLARGIPLLIVLAAGAGAAAVGSLAALSIPRILAGALLGVAVGILASGLLAARLERALRRHVEGLLESSGGAITVESLAEATRDRGPEVLAGRWGARLRRRLLRMLTGSGASGK